MSDDIEQMNEAFEGLNKKFNMNFVPEDDLTQSIDKLQKDIEIFQEKKNEIAEKPEAILEDQEYMKHELKTLIANTKMVMKKLEADIKIGTQARNHEVYATMVRSVNESIRELRELNTTTVELKMKDANISNSGNGKISMTSQQLFDMMDRARESSQMKEIKADFTVSDEDMK